MIATQRLSAPRAVRACSTLRLPLTPRLGIAPESRRRSRQQHRSRMLGVHCNATGDADPPRATSTSEPSQPNAEEQEEVKQLTTWKYGKTTSDKDLPVMYIALMVVPFLAMVALPFIPSF